MKQITRSTLIIAFFFAIDKVLGFVRQLLVTREFKLSYQMDVFNAANNIPDLLSALISGGALAVALIPVIAEFLQTRGKKEAWRLFSHVLNLAFIATGILAVVIYFLAPWMISNIIVPGFPQEQKDLAVSLMRLDLIAIMIFSISGLIMAGLQANQHFLLPAAAPALYNIGQIFGVLILAPEQGLQIGSITLPAFNLGIYGLVYGVILGACLHLLIQIPGLIRYQFHWEPRIDLKSNDLRQVLRLLGPRILTMLFIQLYFIIRDALASGLGEGAVTALNLGWFIMQVPETLLGTAIAIALLPAISSDYATGKLEAYVSKINMSIKAILMLTIPAAALLSLGVYPLVDFAFGLESEGTHQVVLAAQIYLAGMMGHALLEIATRAFYAKKNPRIPLYAAALNAAGYFALSQLLTRWIGFPGIALANIIVFSTEALLLLIILNRQNPGVLVIKTVTVRILFATLVSVGLFLLLSLILRGYSPLIASLAGMAIGMGTALFILRKDLTPFLRPDVKIFD